MDKWLHDNTWCESLLKFDDVVQSNRACKRDICINLLCVLNLWYPCSAFNQCADSDTRGMMRLGDIRVPEEQSLASWKDASLSRGMKWCLYKDVLFRALFHDKQKNFLYFDRRKRRFSEAMNEPLEEEPLFCPPLAMYFPQNLEKLAFCHPHFHNGQEYI